MPNIPKMKYRNKGYNTAGQSTAPAAYVGFPQQSCGVLNPSFPHSLGYVRASTPATLSSFVNNFNCGGFALRLFTKCGTPLLAGGFCKKGEEEQSRHDLLGLSIIEFNKKDNIYDIDLKLAYAVKKCCGLNVWAVGVTAALPNMPQNTGGIIGSPHKDIISADSGVEYLGNNLYMQAFPGGPGYVAMGDSENQFKNLNLTAYPERQKTEALVKYFHTRRISTFFVVSDGSGPGAKGSFLLEIDGKQTFLHF